MVRSATNLESQREVVCVGVGVVRDRVGGRPAAAAVEPGGAVVEQLEGGAVLQRRRERDPVAGRPHRATVLVIRGQACNEEYHCETVVLEFCA